MAPVNRLALQRGIGCSPAVWIGCILARLLPLGGWNATRMRSCLCHGEEGSWSPVNEGFATLPWGAGTRGMVVSQREGLRQDIRSEENVSNARRDGEPPRRSPYADTEAPGAPGREAIQQGDVQRSWRSLKGLLHMGPLRRCATASSVCSGPGRRPRPWRCGWIRWSVGGSCTN